MRRLNLLSSLLVTLALGCGEFGVHLMAGEFIAGDLTGSYQPIERAGTPLGRVPAYHQPVHTLVAIALHRLTPDEVGPAWRRGCSTAGESTPPR